MIDLQWFGDSAEDEGRTHQPSEYKLKRLREEGQLPKSQDLIGAITLLVPAVMLGFLAKHMLRTCTEMFQFFFLRSTELDPTKDAIIAGVFFNYLARLAGPLLAVALFAAFFSNVIQTGFLFTTKPLTPDFSRIIPRFGKYFQRIFSIDGFFKFGMSLVKMLIIGAVVFVLIKSDFEKLINLQKASLWTGMSTVASLALKMLIICAILLLVLAIPDYFFQRYRFREKNKMSAKEVKEEMKQIEGDPQIRNRIRSRFRNLLKQNLAAAVPRADVVITNPTHYAIALEFNKEIMPDSPLITAKGEDEIAARIKNLAKENNVPVVENRPLAQTLYRETEVGDFVPFKYLEVIAMIYNRVVNMSTLNQKMEAKRAARNPKQAAAEEAIA